MFDRDDDNCKYIVNILSKELIQLDYLNMT